MPHRFSVSSRQGSRWWVVSLAIVLLFTGSISSSLAQSGRRPPKQPTSPDPLPPKSDEPPIKPANDKPSVPKIPVKVVWDHRFIGSSTIYSRTVQEACLERLAQSGSINATSGADEMNRKKASDIAKASTDMYVLWFELDVDTTYQDRSGIGNVPPQYLMVNFEVFTPTTGKTKASGHVYQRPRGPGGVVLPGPGTSGSATYSLGYSGQEMADRVLESLGVARPPH